MAIIDLRIEKQMRINAVLATKVTGYTKDEFFKKQVRLVECAIKNGFAKKEILKALQDRNMSRLSIMAAI